MRVLHLVDLALHLLQPLLVLLGLCLGQALLLVTLVNYLLTSLQQNFLTGLLVLAGLTHGLHLTVDQRFLDEDRVFGALGILTLHLEAQVLIVDGRQHAAQLGVLLGVEFGAQLFAAHRR